MLFGRRRTLVFLHDLPEARSAIQAELKRRWVLSSLRSAGVAPGDNSVRAIKQLRDAMPELGLKEAVDTCGEVRRRVRLNELDARGQRVRPLGHAA